MTKDEWDAMMLDSQEGRYLNDDKHWLERGWLNDKWQYRFDSRSSTVMVTEESTFEGERAHSVKITIPEVPTDYLLVCRLLARYLRNPELVFDGVFETGVWFYVPEGYYPIVYLSMEDHALTGPETAWEEFIITNIALDTSDGSLLVYHKGYNQTLGAVDFQHDNWFKLWILYNSDTKTYTCGYESTGEEKTYQIEEPWVAYNNYIFQGYIAYNFYAGGWNPSHDTSQIMYVDGFYTKIVEKL